MFRPLFSLFAGVFLLAACETASTITEEQAKHQQHHHLVLLLLQHQLKKLHCKKRAVN